MDLTPKSFLSSSSRLRSLSRDQMVFETASAYSSPARARPHQMDHHSQQPQTGLGISQCQMEIPFSQLRLCSPLDTYQSPPGRWSETVITTEPFYENTLNTSDLSSMPCYDPYGGLTPVSHSSLSLYSTQTLSASPNYSPSTDTNESHNTFAGQFLDTWSAAPCSGTATPLEGFTSIKEEVDESWDPFLLPGASDTTPEQMLMQMPQFAVNNTFLGSQMPNPRMDSRLLELDPNVGRPLERNRRATVQDTSADPVTRANRTNTKAPKPGKIPSASGLQCPVCSYTFTRRSNCREHMKRHDPACQRAYPCEFCGRSFGRRTDLRRHVDSIHHGYRKFGCEQCGRRFSRQDTLSRHRVDGCRRKPRKSAVTDMPGKTNQQSHPLPASATPKRQSKRNRSLQEE